MLKKHDSQVIAYMRQNRWVVYYSPQLEKEFRLKKHVLEIELGGTKPITLHFDWFSSGHSYR